MIEIQEDADYLDPNSPQKRHPERSASQIYRVPQGLVARFGGRKGTSSMGKMSILEVPSAALRTGSSDCAPTSAVSRDKSATRFAQDDDFVASWTKTPRQGSAYGRTPGRFHASLRD